MAIAQYLSTCCVSDVSEYEAKDCISWIESFHGMYAPENAIPSSITFRVSHDAERDSYAVFADFDSVEQLDEYSGRLFQMSLMYKYGVQCGQRMVKRQLETIIG